MLPKLKTLLPLTLLLTCTVCSVAQTPVATKYFEWHKQGRIIQTPVFDHSQTDIAFGSRFYIPGGHNAEEREGYVDSLLAKAVAEKRFDDPVIYVLSLTTKQMLQVDYGWAPQFSTDDSRIVYIRVGMVKKL